MEWNTMPTFKKAIIFDMDGVIIDSEPIHYKIIQDMLKDRNIVISVNKFNHFAGLSNMEFWSILKKQFDLKESVEDLCQKQLNKTLEYFQRNDITPIAEIPTLLKVLKEKGYKIALASSSPLVLIQTIIEKLAIQHYFENIISGEFFKKSKPHPEIFLHTAKTLQVAPENCIVIEDSSNGVIAAKRANMKCIGYRNINSGNQDLSGADFIVDSLGKININLF